MTFGDEGYREHVSPFTYLSPLAHLTLPRLCACPVVGMCQELLAAMEAIDDLFNANKVHTTAMIYPHSSTSTSRHHKHVHGPHPARSQLSSSHRCPPCLLSPCASQVNLQIFAVVPALFTTWVLYRVVVYVVGVLSSRRIYSTAGVHRALRHSLRDMERLLTLAPRLLPPHTGASLLDEQGLGWLVLHLTDFHTIVRVNAARLDKAVRRTLVEEDLTDLLTGRQTLEQQLASLNRIRRSYGFLQVRSNGPLFEFIT